MLPAAPAPDPPHVAANRLLQIIEARFGDGIKGARPARAAPPSPDAEKLRRAYLDLLKLCLCDLAGTTTRSVARTTEGDVMSRELAGEELRFRAAGLDWPLQGLTMVGLTRLDDLQACVEEVVSDGVEGDLIEVGTWRGGASIVMRATLDSLGERERTVWVADSFQGFPQVDRSPAADGYDLGADLAACDFLAVPVEEVKASFDRFGLNTGVTFLPGFFEDTLPSLSRQHWSLIRLDGDTYDATRLALEETYPYLSTGGYLIVDDYLPLDQCREAVDVFRRECHISEEIVAVDWSGVRWRKQNEGPLDDRSVRARPSASHPHVHRSPRPVERPLRARVPAIEELKLRHELSQLQDRVRVLEAEIDRLTRAPLAGTRTWLRRRRTARAANER
jgi:O-methyltransferase